MHSPCVVLVSLEEHGIELTQEKEDWPDLLDDVWATAEYELDAFNHRNFDCATRVDVVPDSPHPGIVLGGLERERFLHCLETSRKASLRAAHQMLAQFLRTEKETPVLDENLLERLGSAPESFPGWYAVMAVTLAHGHFTFHSGFLVTMTGFSRLAPEELERVKKNPEHYALCLFDLKS